MTLLSLICIVPFISHLNRLIKESSN